MSIFLLESIYFGIKRAHIHICIYILLNKSLQESDVCACFFSSTAKNHRCSDAGQQISQTTFSAAQQRPLGFPPKLLICSFFKPKVARRNYSPRQQMWEQLRSLCSGGGGSWSRGLSYAVMSVSVQQAAADGKHKAQWPLAAALTHLTWRDHSRGFDNLHSCSGFDGWFHLTDLCCKLKKKKMKVLL